MPFSCSFRLLEFKILRFTPNTMMTHPQVQFYNISEIQIKFTIKSKFIKIIGLSVNSTIFRLVFRNPLQSEQKIS